MISLKRLKSKNKNKKYSEKEIRSVVTTGRRRRYPCRKVVERFKLPIITYVDYN